MKNSKPYVGVVAFLFAFSVANAGDLDNLSELALRYFHAKVATQQPDATPEDLEAYLALLTDDVGYEHKPYMLLGEGSAERAGGKLRMREGMTYYLGGNERFTAKLEKVALGFNAVAIQYSGIHEFRRGGEGPVLTENYTVMEVLEIVDGKVSIIREYQE